MRVDEIVRRVQSSFGDKNESQITIQDIVDWTNAGQRVIARETEILQGLATLDTVVNQSWIALPSDFVRDQRVEHLTNKLLRTSLAELDNLQFPDNPQDITGNQANAYYIWGDKLYLYPNPNVSTVGAVLLWYTRLPSSVVTVDDSPEVPEFMHEDLITYCMMKAREVNEEYDQVNANASAFTAQLAKTKDEARNPSSDSYPAVRDYQGDIWW